MCCTYSNATKAKCQKVFTGISIILGIFGILDLAMGSMSGGGAPEALEK